MIRPGRAFAPVMEVARLLAGFPRPWFIAGGWAIDLFLGHLTRDHEDVDVTILRRDQQELRSYLSDWTFEKVVDRRREAWREEWLDLPVHEVHARRASGAPPEVEFLLNEARDDTWVFRRDARITQTWSKASGVARHGIPYLDPAIVLLFKAKSPAAKDLADFDSMRRHLGSERYDWLRASLETCHPGHPWIDQL